MFREESLNELSEKNIPEGQFDLFQSTALKIQWRLILLASYVVLG